MDVTKWIEDRIILKVFRGSHSYGTNHENSDIDFGGICIPPKEYIIGFENFEQYECKDYIDYPGYKEGNNKAEATIFGLHKFINLASNCNPNIIEHLFTDSKHIVNCNEFGKILLDNRNLFLTKRAKHTFGGYAYTQLKRLTNKLPVDELKQRIKNLNEHKRQYNIYLTKLNYKLEIVKNNIDIGYITDNDAEKIIELNNEINDYESRIISIDQEIDKVKEEMGRGQHKHIGSHKNLIEQYGFDVKHGLHLIRLLFMGIEILETGHLSVLRPEREYLLEIRNGKYSLEQVKSHAEKLFIQLDEAYDKSKLSHFPDRKKINDLLCDMILQSFDKYKN